MVYRVIQWSTGNVGANAVRAVADNPQTKLVGAYTYSEAKSGQDVGEICGIGKVGAKATNDVEKLVRMNADVVIHTPLPSLVYGEDPELDIDIICRLLASGKNVITVVGYMYPKVHGPALVKRLEEACRAGGSSFHSTGLNPGWLGDLLPLSMSSLSRRIDNIHVTEISDFSYYPSPEIMLDVMGFGKSLAQFKKEGKRRTHWLNGLFRENIQMIADGLGIKLDRISDKLEVDTAKKTFDVAAGPIAKGSVSGQHWTWSGMVGRKAVITHETIWRMGPDAGKDWPTGNHTVAITGDPNMKVEFAADWISDGLLGTAMHAVNAIPHVCDAPAGIQTFLELPNIYGQGVGPSSKKAAPKKAAKKK
jgi:2,4-diaminopentanoate dehydrogenase